MFCDTQTLNTQKPQNRTFVRQDTVPWLPRPAKKTSWISIRNYLENNQLTYHPSD
jgi:hypothetical protein